LNSELEEKTERLKRLLASEKLSGVILNAQHNFAWITCGRSNGIDQTRDAGASYIFVRNDGKRFLIANNIEISRLLAEEVSQEDFEPIEISWQSEKSSSHSVISAAKSLLKNDGEIATDVNISSEARSIEPLISACRYQLTPNEIDRFRKLGRDAGEALGKVSRHVSPGETELEIARNVRDTLAEYNTFAVVTLVGVDERIERYRHPVPTAKIWKNNLLIAVCARGHGLIVSLSRMICVGDVTSELQSRTEATAVVSATLQAATVVGATASELYRTAAKAYTDLGFSSEIDKHHQGGSCGYRTREWLAHPTSTEQVRDAQAFAWNPSITGTKTEVTGIVGQEGFEAVTPATGFPHIVTQIEGREYLSPGILSLSKGAAA
jgi:Xaa-Pro dipeptidase